MLLALDAGWYPLPPPPPPPPRCPVGGDDTHTLGPALCTDDDPVDLVDLVVIVVAPVDAEEDSELSLCNICGTKKRVLEMEGRARWRSFHI